MTNVIDSPERLVASSDDPIRTWFVWWWSMSTCVLMSLTWRLWIPQSEASPIDFPRVPLLSSTLQLPAWCDTGISLGIVGCALLAPWLHLGWPTRAAMSLSAILMMISMGVNQHRLQPWAYQLAILAIIGSLRSWRRQVMWGRALLISIYLYSAASKLDYQFLHTLGQQFLTSIEHLFGTVLAIPAPFRIPLAIVFPLFEGSVGLGLSWKRTRRAAVWCAALLHLALVLILGPWGLHHQSAVLCWNLAFAILVPLLFWRDAARDTHDFGRSADEVRQSSLLIGAMRGEWDKAKQVVLLCVFIIPLLEPWGLCDHWPAWQLYAPRNSRVIVSVMADDRTRLPAGLQPLVSRDDADPFWMRIDIDRWSLESLSVPIYPQDRFQHGVAISLAERFGLEGKIRVERQGVSNRWTGARTREIYRGAEQLRVGVSRYHLNALPRR